MPPRQPPRPPRSNILRIVLIVVVVGAVLMLLAGGLVTSLLESASLGFGEKIGVLEVEGAIGDGRAYEARSRELVRSLQKWSEDDSIKGIVVRINSPGGTVAATQEVYEEIRNYREKTERPVIASMGDIAASGGYYTAAACDEIFANPGSLTGSIGVILSFANVQDLTDKIGIRFTTIKSGEYKDIGSGFRPMTEEERGLLQDMIDDVYDQFVEAVLEGRGDVFREVLAERLEKDEALLTDDEITSHARALADGRIFSGTQAHDEGLVDQIGTLQDAIRRVEMLAGIKGKPKLVSSRVPRTLFDVLGSETKSVLRQMTPGLVSIEYRFVYP